MRVKCTYKYRPADSLTGSDYGMHRTIVGEFNGPRINDGFSRRILPRRKDRQGTGQTHGVNSIT